MRTLETNDWMMLNNIIYKIHTVRDLTEMREQFLDQIKLLIDFDSADFFLADRSGANALVDPVLYNIEEDQSAHYDELDYSRGILYSGRTLIYRETDLISEEQRVETEYYKKVYMPNKWHYSLQVILARHKEFVGCITFYRTIGKENFEYDDIFILDVLKDHLTYRLYNSKKQFEVVEEKLTISEAVRKFELTRKEHTVLKMLMEGKTVDEICDALTITSNTLKKHILNIYRKLGINNRVQLFKMIKEME